MRFSAITTLALCAAAASASAADSSLNVASVISAFYPTSTPSLNGAQSTSLASLLNSVQSTWEDSASYTSANEAIYSAAPSSVQSSIDKSGYYYGQITSQAWYTKSVPGAIQTAVAKEISAIDSAAEKVLGTASSTGAAAAMRTAAPIMGAVALAGGIFAAM
ncbi:uncharacterized protein LY89DRAFT_691109 [Mollisia scopiformis]|uniref:Uncharacterized protein n=1 Tax=Mollisia scopiformis TaxID=149040 RepID=A0A132B791_MOLSC|nr:uncharacterized protein LY89DRAFT_691109 [Mollisia scopiformis]KUJ08211.1 hypothetical protein LY89DRAFT_691109 [Mollisia scopiformis]